MVHDQAITFNSFYKLLKVFFQVGNRMGADSMGALPHHQIILPQGGKSLVVGSEPTVCISVEGFLETRVCQSSLDADMELVRHMKSKPSPCRPAFRRYGWREG